jgi:hypothetical protein
MTQRQLEDPRRRLLLRALAAGALATGYAGNGPAQRLGKVPKPLPRGKSIYELDGTVEVNGAAADAATAISATSTVTTAAGGRAIFVVGKDAFLLRENSQLQLTGTGLLVQGLRLVSGALLSVFGTTRHSLVTPTSTIGIRGTGLYVEADPDQSYICTCYGVVDLAATADSTQSQTVASRHHDAPRYVLAAGGALIRPAPFRNHTDLELALIEALVGRTPPFPVFDNSYGGPRRY